jgi:hypothetical protein
MLMITGTKPTPKSMTLFTNAKAMAVLLSFSQPFQQRTKMAVTTIQTLCRVKWHPYNDDSEQN